MNENELFINDPFYSETNLKRLEKAIADINAGKGKVHNIVEVDSD